MRACRVCVTPQRRYLALIRYRTCLSPLPFEYNTRTESESTWLIALTSPLIIGAVRCRPASCLQDWTNLRDGSSLNTSPAASRRS